METRTCKSSSCGECDTDDVSISIPDATISDCQIQSRSCDSLSSDNSDIDEIFISSGATDTYFTETETERR